VRWVYTFGKTYQSGTINICAFITLNELLVGKRDEKTSKYIVKYQLLS
jgi:hypothetical protein